MSIEIMQEVWKNAPVDQGTLLVLLALADSADEASRTCYPGIKSLSKKSRLGERQVKRCISLLTENGILAVRRNASPLKTNLYKIEPDYRWRSDIMSPTKDECRSDTHVTSDVTPMSPKPSVTSVKEKIYKKGEAELFPDLPSSQQLDPEIEAIESGFEEFWNEVWPKHNRKSQKADCRDLYIKTCQGKFAKADKVSPTTLNRATRGYIAKEKANQNFQYLKGPLPWLRQPGWEPFMDQGDEISPERQRLRKIIAESGGAV